MMTYFSQETNDTKKLGAWFASKLTKGDTLVLSGDLGAGKTVFVSGFLSYYGKENENASPTFTIINEHALQKDLTLYHFDVYRFENEEEFTAIGGEEFFEKGICIIEWGERIKNLLPPSYIKITISKCEEDFNKRKIEIQAVGEKYQDLVKEVESL